MGLLVFFTIGAFAKYIPSSLTLHLQILPYYIGYVNRNFLSVYDIHYSDKKNKNVAWQATFFINCCVIMPRSFRDFHADICEGRGAAVREYGDVCSVDGVRDPGAERFRVVDIQHDDLVFTDELYVMDIRF